jgi:hypothetical protein
LFARMCRTAEVATASCLLGHASGRTSGNRAKTVAAKT